MLIRAVHDLIRKKKRLEVSAEDFQVLDLGFQSVEVGQKCA